MKIDIDRVGAGTGAPKEAAGHRPAIRPSREEARSPAPQAAMSSRLKEIGSTLAEGGSFDAARVAEIRAAIAGGSFRVDAEVVADRMIASTHEALVKRH